MEFVQPKACCCTKKLYPSIIEENAKTPRDELVVLPDIIPAMINGQVVTMNSVVLPEGLNLGDSMMMTANPTFGSLAYDITTGALWYGASLSNWTRISSGTGDVTLAAFGTVPNAAGASLTGQQLQLQPADASNPGGVSTTSQAFTGVKDFSISGIILRPGSVSMGVINVLRNYAYFTGTITWTGAVTPNVTGYGYSIEVIGHQITLYLPSILNPGTQAAGLLSTTTPVPAEFRPVTDELTYITVISSSVSGGTATMATTSGIIALRSTGIIDIGIAVNNAGVLANFGEMGITGSGNGFINGAFTFFSS